jgi:phosphodiesterase/alkaline phosphatase D-like protein
MSSATSASITIVDSKSNTWQSDVQKTNSGGTAGLAVTMASVVPTTALITGDTVTITSTSSGYHLCGLYEPSQVILTSNAVDVTAVANSTAGTTTPGTAGITTTTTSSVVYGVVAWENTDLTYAEAGGWTHDTTLSVVGAKTKAMAIAEQTLTGGSSTYSGTLGTLSQWSAVTVAYKVTGGIVPGALTYRWTGTSTTDGAFISTLTSNAASVRLKISTASDLSVSPVFSSAVVPDANQWAQHTVTGLAGNTQYYYGVEVDAVVNTAKIGSFKTLPPVGSSASYTLAFGSCLDNTAGSPLSWNGMMAFNPLQFLHLGDFHYADIITADQTAFRNAMQGQFANNAALETTLGTIPTTYISSDHDSGNNDWSPAPGTQTPSFMLMYRQMVPHMALQASDSNYFAYTIGRIRYIFLDTRAYRSANSATDNSSKTMIGTTQKTWLKAELVRSEPVKCIVTELPWIETPTVGSDKWGGFSTERAEITTYISTNSVRAFIIHGDSHMLAADDGTNAGGIPVFCAAPFSKTTSIKGGPYSGGTWPTAGNTGAVAHHYGRLTIADTGNNISVTFTGTDADAAIDRISMTKTWTISAGSGTGAKPRFIRLAGAWVAKARQFRRVGSWSAIP